MNRYLFIIFFMGGVLVAKPYVYLDLEGLYLQRGGSKHKVLISYDDGVNRRSVVNTKQLVHTLGYQPAFRISVGANSDTHGGFFRGLISYEWQGSKSSSIGNLRFPFKVQSYAPGYYGANSAKVVYKTSLALIEGYFTRDFTPLWGDYFAVRGMWGFQYWNVPEKLTDTFNSIQGSSNQSNTYLAKTNNNLGLIGLGLMLQIKPMDCLAMELIGYGAAGGNYITSKTNLKINNNTTSLRSSNQADGAGAYSFQATVRAVYRPVHFFEIGAGYELLYAGGLALASQQMSDKVKSTSDNRVAKEASVWYQGASIRVGFKL